MRVYTDNDAIKNFLATEKISSGWKKSITVAYSWARMAQQKNTGFFYNYPQIS